jgi:pyochelin biosynthetic protein PchC
MYASASRWLVRFTSRPEAALRLICFSHAGGSASAYRDWATDLPDRIEVVAVEYPGRGSQIAEPACTAMADLAEAATEALSPLTERPYALFGHSMGAAAAYETALRLREQEKPEPVRLVVSGREPPQHSHGCTVHLGRPEALLGELLRFGGTPPELLGDAEIRALLLDRMAADCRLIETYRPAGTIEALRCPVSAVVGDQDPDVTVAEMADWAVVTSGSFDITMFPGDHFYLLAQRRPLLAHLATLL